MGELNKITTMLKPGLRNRNEDEMKFCKLRATFFCRPIGIGLADGRQKRTEDGWKQNKISAHNLMRNSI